MIERITDLPGGIFGVRAMGTLTADDYESMIAPFVDDVRRNRKRVRCLVEVGPGFTGVTPAAAWEDVKLGLRAMRAFDGCAVLTDDDRIRGASRVGAFLLPCPVRLFALGERSAAVAWLTSLPAGAAIRRGLSNRVWSSSRSSSHCAPRTSSFSPRSSTAGWPTMPR